MTAATKTTPRAARTPISHDRGTLPSRSTRLLGVLFLGTVYSLPGTGVTVGVTRGAGV